MVWPAHMSTFLTTPHTVVSVSLCFCVYRCPMMVQCVQLKSLAVYFDCDKPLLDPGKRWDLITVGRWDELLLPANQFNNGSQQQQQLSSAPAAAWVASSADSAPPPQQQQLQQPQQPYQHQFLLCPVDGTLRYVRRGRAARKLETDAEQEVQLQLVQIGLQVHQLQYQSSQKLLQEFDRYAASAPHRHLRPHCRPATRESHRTAHASVSIATNTIFNQGSLACAGRQKRWQTD